MDPDVAAQRGRELVATLLGPPWTFRFDRARRRFGLCDHRTATISISRVLVALNSEEEFLDAVLHEVAHGLAGPRAGHGPAWRELASALGATPARCYDGESVRQPPGYLGRCPSCDARISRARRIAVACRVCCDRFNAGHFHDAFLFVWGARAGLEPSFGTSPLPGGLTVP